MSCPDFDFIRSLHLGQLDELFKKCLAEKRLGLLQIVQSRSAQLVSDADLEELKNHENSEIKKFDEAIESAKANAGDVEVKNALLAKAEFLVAQGHKDLSISVLGEALKKTVGSGSRIDNLLLQARVGFFFDDVSLVSSSLKAVEAELEKGGDWERKNKFLVYQGLLWMSQRKFKETAEVFVKVVPTFTATELISLKEFTLYTVVAGLLELDRASIRAKILASSEILAVSPEIPALQDAMESLFVGAYGNFFISLVQLADEMRKDPHLHPHTNWILKKFRVLAYKQFLFSFKSVKIEKMAGDFGIPVEFLEKEICEFCLDGLLNVKIDKINGILESTNVDLRSKKFQQILKQADNTLNKLQSLSKIADI